MAKNIDTKLENIQGLFSSTNSQDSILGLDGIYIIPEYQRAYNWRYNEQCDKLWQDIESFIENSSNTSYFFGSIIINSDRDILYVVDGQQRLTTFILLLKALLIRINNVLEKISSDEDSKSIKEALENRRKSILSCLYIIDEDDISQVTTGTIRLQDLKIKYENRSINEKCSGDVKKILQGEYFEAIKESVTEIKYKQGDNRYSNFFRNFKYFCEKLESYDSTKLNAFAKKLLNNCQIIVIVSYQTEEAIEIFNSLNSTGMPLADADILSAKLYSNYTGNRHEFNEKWGNIIKITNELNAQKICSIDDILNQYMYILRARQNKKDTTLPGVRRYFTDINQEPLKNPRIFIEDFEKIIDIWQNETNENEAGGETRNNLQNLKQVLFALNRNFKFYYATYFFFNKDKSLAEKELFVSALLKLFALLEIGSWGYSSSKFKVFLIGLNVEISAGVSTRELVRLINEHIHNNFNKEEILKILSEANPGNGIVYLNEYLFAQEKNIPINLSTKKIEIEHIMPASGRNIVAIREDAGMDEKTFKQYANRIGNKILLEQSINGSISNDWFRVKKQNSVKDKRGYKDSDFPIARSLVEYEKNVWRQEDIDDATEKASRRITDFIFDSVHSL